MLNWSLRPLQRVINELTRVQRGQASRMTERHPRELEPLTESSNAFIESERENLDRQRTTLADLARFGEMMRNEGQFNGQQIIPKAVVQDIARGASQAHFAKGGYPLLKDWSYRNMWWVTHNEHGAYMARGIHGQSIYVDPKAEMVIVRYAAHPIAANGANDPLTLPAYHAVAKSLMKP